MKTKRNWEMKRICKNLVGVKYDFGKRIKNFNNKKQPAEKRAVCLA